jgi:hypothetical protein
MTVNQFKLNAAQTIAWAIPKPPVGCTPVVVYIGRDDSGVGAIQVALANVTAPPSRETLRVLHLARKGKSNVQLIVGAVFGELIWLFGPDERAEIIEAFPLDQVLRQLQSALNEPNALAAYTRLGQFRRSIDSTSLPGFINSGLFASYHIRENVPTRLDWFDQCERAKAWLSLRDEALIKGLGYLTEKTAGHALILSSITPVPKAVAVLLDESEQFDGASEKHSLLSPVAWGLNVATRQGVPWLILLRKDQIRLYPARDGVGVGQKGQVETFFEIDLAAIDADKAGLLALVFSADALAENGTASQLLEASRKFASQLGVRLRERIYENVVPQLAKSVAERLREQGFSLDVEGLALAYRLTLRILFRLLFQAYAEDRGLLPAGRNESYDANSLKTIARRYRDTPEEDFGDAQSLWLDLIQVWNAIDAGNKTWDVPSYNGGLFGTDPDLHPDGVRIERLGLHDSVIGPALQHLLVDDTEDGVRGPVDFRSLSVREFGTIYEGLLESSLSVADQNLTVDPKGAWVPAKKDDKILSFEGEVFFHSASGERKATGSYFTPSLLVDHLIESALDPALASHLKRIEGLLQIGDQVAAARDFFDFRVADLAMGSGHFLVAAVDRIEARMRTFLTEPSTNIPAINAELIRLSQTAKLALGTDTLAISEIEPSSLLRRQIARRCIYGLDINPLAVELARLALWIHTFVPGLPMSSLDHGLVCANSLTGIGTIEEAKGALSPDSHTSQISFYEDVISENLMRARDLLTDVANSDEAKKSEVKAAAKIATLAKEAAEPARLIFDAAVAARLGHFDPRAVFDEESLRKIGKSSQVVEAIEPMKPAHMPFLFPEVFLRDNPGFDVLIGNPPWEELMLEEPKFWLRIQPGLLGLNATALKGTISKLRAEYPEMVAEFERQSETIAGVRKILLKGPYPGLGTGDVDLYQAFAWRNWHLLRRGGSLGLVFPRSLLNGASGALWRNEVLSNSKCELITLLNTGGWIFPNVHGQYSIALVSAVKGKIRDSAIGLGGPFSSEKEFAKGRHHLGYLPFDLLKKYSTGASIPQLPDEKSVEVFTQLRRSPRFDSFTDWEFRPVAEFHATNDRSTFDAGPRKGRWPVLGGFSFNIWQPETAETYAWADPKVVKRALFEKRKNQARSKASAFHGLNPKLLNDESTLPCLSPRIAFRDVTNATNTRTLIAALIPGECLLTNTAPYLLRIRGNAKDEAYLLAILSSISLDWYARRYVELHVNFHIFNGFPIPIIPDTDPIRQRVINISGQLAARDERYAAWAKEVGVKVGKVQTDSEQFPLVAELDALVAHLYGLNRDQLIHLFKTFHRGWDYKPQLEATLEFFDSWKMKSE